MIAWERHIDATRDDAAALYTRLSAPVSFADGSPAVYGFGLNRGTEFGRALTGHGGALRGWRSHRLYLPSERISVVAMFNHLSDAHGAAMDLLAAALGEEQPTAATAAPPDWLGSYVEPDTGLSVRIEARDEGDPTALRALSGGTGCSPMGRPSATTAACGCDRQTTGCGWTGRTRTSRHACCRSRGRRPETSPAASTARNWTPN